MDLTKEIDLYIKYNVSLSEDRYFSIYKCTHYFEAAIVDNNNYYQRYTLTIGTKSICLKHQADRGSFFSLGIHLGNKDD